MRFVLASLFLSSSLIAAPHDEMQIVKELIDTTKKNLYSQQALLDIMVKYNSAREAFLANPESGKLAAGLVKQAMQLQKHLANEHLTHLFSNDFLKELAFYNQVGKQQFPRD